MDKNNLFLLKIGEREHLKDLIDGQLYCSPSEKYIKQERDLHDKGQGDLLEGKMKIKVAGGHWEDNATHAKIKLLPNSVITIRIENVNNMPIFCMTKGTAEDCEEYKSDTEYVIKYKKSFKEEVERSFKKADSAVIILEPKRFIGSISNTINHAIFAEDIHYFDYDIMDINMMYYLLGVDKFESNKAYSMVYDNRYRHLLCKDISFGEQREHRIIILDDEIIEPQKYKFKFDSKYLLVDLEDLFTGISVKIK